MKYKHLFILAPIFLLNVLEVKALDSDFNYGKFCDSQNFDEELCAWEKQRESINLLSRALGEFLASDRYLMQSELKVTGKFTGGSISVSAGVKTIIEKSNKIRSQITFHRSDGSVGSQYLVVSNGDRVWIYDRKQKVYSVMSYKNFVEYNETFLIGLLTNISLEIQENTKNDLIWQNFSKAELTKAIEAELQANHQAVKSETRTLAQTQYKTYEYILPESNYKITAYVKPATAAIEQLHLLVREEDINVFIKEKVIQKQILPSVDSKAFQFVPPEDAKQVDKPLSITPFQ